MFNDHSLSSSGQFSQCEFSIRRSDSDGMTQAAYLASECDYCERAVSDGHPLLRMVRRLAVVHDIEFQARMRR